jgi:3-phenylpropionate/trans-cinnamate dioxygenase ferredoxin subunit
MEYRVVAHTDEVPEGSKKKVDLNGKALLLTNVQGTYYAIDNRCPHLGGSLFDGTLNGDRITCPKHGASFDVKTGKAVQGAKIAFLKLDVHDTHVYPVQVNGTDILVGVE